MTASEWDQRYGGERVWSGRVNPTLEACVRDLTPGRALEGGAGEGGDAIWLARQGWQVTAVDFSAAGLARAAAAADDAGVSVTWVCADLLDWAPGATFDLVTSHFLQLDPEPRRRAFGTLAAAVAPGGRLLVVGHHPSILETDWPHPHDPQRFFTADEVVADLGPGWTVELNAARPRSAVRDGRTLQIEDTVLLARRDG